MWNKNDLIKSIKKIKREIIDSKQELTKVNEQKETWFKKKEELKNQISSLIKKIKELKSVSDKSTISLKKLTQERDKYNKKVKELILKIKEINKDHKLKDYKPKNVNEQIEELEQKIETEPLTFEQEQRTMKKIKQLKKEQQGDNALKEIYNSSKNISEAIEENKKRAEEYHNQILGLMHQKKNFETFANLSKEIQLLKKEQETAFNRFIEFKNKFSGLNDKLKDNLSDLNKNQKELKKQEKDTKEERTKKKVKEKTKEVEEKIKQKKKLTTEDLLIYQQSEDK